MNPTSIYMDGLQNQWLFYADYIIMKKDGTVWVIETNGGESKDKDKNIDIQIENKFNSFKNFAAEHPSTGDSSETKTISFTSTIQNSHMI